MCFFEYGSEASTYGHYKRYPSSFDPLAVRAGGPPILIVGTLNNPFTGFSCLTL